MKSQPLVSLNIRTFNSERTIGKTLDSIKKQTYKRIEILLCDSHSTDDTVKIAKKYKKIKICYPKKFEDPRIKNYKISKGKYIFTVDSDQVLDKDLIKKCVDLAERKKLDAVTISEKSLIIKNTLMERLISYDKWVIDQNEDDDSLFGTACPRFFRRDLLKDIKWPLKFSMFDDTIIYDDLLAKHARVDYLSSASIWHHEVTSWKVFIRKFHKYGKSYIQAFLKKPTTVAVHSLPRRSYFSKAAFKKPLYFLGLLLLYTVKALAAMAGALTYIFENIFRKKRHVKKNSLGILLVCLLVFLSYSPVLNGFFQQDEWSSFAYNFAIPKEDIVRISFAPNAGHYQPLNTLTLHSLVSIFRVNYLPYAIISVGLHLVSIALVFVLVQRIYKNAIIAFATSLLFGVTASTYQATTWVMADLGIHLSTIFALLSLIFFVNFITSEKRNHLVASMVSLIISLLFKETAIGFFAFLPIAFFIFAKKLLIKKIKYPLAILGVGIGYLAMRVTFLLSPVPGAYNVVALNTQTPLQVLYNVLSYPFKALSQSIMPVSILVDMATWMGQFFPVKIAGQPGTTPFDVFTQKYVLESISFSLFAIISLICFLIFKNQKTHIKKVVISAFLFVFFNGLIYGLSPERTGIVTSLDSRNLYLVSGAVSLIIVSLIWKLDKLSNKSRIFLFVAVLALNLFLLEKKLSELVSTANQRRQIINEIRSDYPKLPREVVFYTESDTSFYGLPITEKILPFQSGFGQTLLMVYYDIQGYPPEMTSNRFLWELTDQGYKKVGDKGFGYFRDFNLLKKSLKDNKVSGDSVIAYKYNSQTQNLENISENVRQRLKSSK